MHYGIFQQTHEDEHVARNDVDIHGRGVRNFRPTTSVQKAAHCKDRDDTEGYPRGDRAGIYPEGYPA